MADNFENDFVKYILETSNPNLTRLYTIGGAYNISIKSLEHAGNNIIIIEEEGGIKFFPIMGIPYVLSYDHIFYVIRFTEVIIGNKLYFIVTGAQNASRESDKDSESKGVASGVSSKEVCHE